jgi:hypothetical protein
LPTSTKTIRDLQREEKARQARTFLKANWHQLINPTGLHDLNEEDEATFGRDYAQFLQDERRRRDNFERNFAPDKQAPGFATPQATGAAQVIAVKSRVSKADLPRRRKLLDLAKTIRETSDRAIKGAALAEAKTSLGHGDWLGWLTKETSLSAKTAQRLMAEAKTV